MADSVHRLVWTNRLFGGGFCYYLDMREERTEKVMTLAHLKELQSASKYPEQYIGAIKRIRWELLGMYRTATNINKIHERTPDKDTVQGVSM